MFRIELMLIKCFSANESLGATSGDINESHVELLLNSVLIKVSNTRSSYRVNGLPAFGKWIL